MKCNWQRFLAGLTFLAAVLSCNCPAANHDKEGDQKPASQPVREAGCAVRFEKAGVCASIEFLEDPVVDSVQELLLIFRNTSTGKLQSLASLPKLSLWMQMGNMGHPSSKKPQVVQVSDDRPKVIPGLYRVENVYYTMGSMEGKYPWEIKVTVKSADGNDETQSIKVIVPDAEK